MGKHRVAGVASGLIAVMILVGCGSSSSKPATTTQAPTTTLDPATADAAAKLGWEAFFNATSPTDTRLTHLEDAAALKPVLLAQPQVPTTAHAKKVRVQYGADCTGNGVVSPCAVMTYDILLSGAVVIGDSTAYAVYLDGTWKVSKIAFCGLIGLTTKTPPPQCA